MKKAVCSAAALFATFVVAWAEKTSESAPKERTAKESTPAKAKSPTSAQPTGPAVPVDLSPIHNGFKLGRSLYSGSCPYGDAGFKALAANGIKTIISVDGARPDEAMAKKYGMRYVHIPVTYSGITRAQALSMARAVRDLPGPVFIHCHHGKHRGPTAAVLAIMVSEGWTTDQALAALQQAGTAPSYKGLWANARDWQPPAKQELEQADVSFPSTAQVHDYTTAAMVSIDERWQHLSQVRAAHWGVPADHLDIDPPHEALLLREHFTELLRLPDTAKYPKDYRAQMTQAEAAAHVLEQALREKDKEKARSAYQAVSETCTSCHVGYRNNKGTTQ